jgi:hypothetical protein
VLPNDQGAHSAFRDDQTSRLVMVKLEKTEVRPAILFSLFSYTLRDYAPS